MAARLTGASVPPPALPAGAVLVADELLPSHFLALPARPAAICLARGGPTSHVAILAASAGIPMVVALGTRLLEVEDGQPLLVDADAASVDTAPTLAAREDAASRLAAAAHARTEASARAHEAARTADGARIEVFANLGSTADAREAVAAGAEGCGLLRTEFLFLDRDTAPDEDEQAAVYREIAGIMGERPVIVRTLDIGGDKPVPYLALPPEENPALGQRGIRLCLARPELLRTQLAAILRAWPAEHCRIMLPMVSDAGELRAARQMLDELGGGVAQLGVMIETPAAALVADTLAADAAFLSIGSNDLTQYALAADRGNAAVASLVDGLHPAVLRLIDMAARGAAGHGRPLGLCGALASDPATAPLLIGLGVTELSATSNAVPSVKAAVRATRLDEARALAGRALACPDAAAVRALLEETGR